MATPMKAANVAQKIPAYREHQLLQIFPVWKSDFRILHYNLYVQPQNNENQAGGT